MNATNEIQPALVEMFLETSRNSTPDQRATVVERIRAMVARNETTTVKGEKVSGATFAEIVRRLEAN